MIEIYFDESGDNGLNIRPNMTEKWFVISAIIVDTTNRSNLVSLLQNVADKYFDGKEIKSAHLKNNTIRSEVLKMIKSHLWHGVILQVDKSLLDIDKFKWKKSFYKRVPRQLYGYLITAHNNVKLYPDNIGDEEFRSSLKKYFNKHLPQDLFSETSLEFSSSKECRINQLADICAGTLFRDLKDGTSLFKEVESQFNLRKWPNNIFEIEDLEVNHSKNIEKELITASIEFARAFVNCNVKNNDQLKIDQSVLATYLIDEIINGDPSRYVPTRELLFEISKERKSPISDYYLRTKVIGKLRTHDVMIVSNRRGGYKLPVNYSEIEEYFMNMKEKIDPMIVKANALASHIHTILGKKIFDDARWKCLESQDDIIN